MTNMWRNAVPYCNEFSTPNANTSVLAGQQVKVEWNGSYGCIDSRTKRWHIPHPHVGFDASWDEWLTLLE